MKVDNKVIHLKEGKGQKCEWLTLYRGDEVPPRWGESFSSQGGKVLKEEVKEVKPVIVEEVVEEKVEEVVEEVVEEKIIHTKDELFSMYKSAQVSLLEELGSEEIPRYEKDRVELILKLQGNK